MARFTLGVALLLFMGLSSVTALYSSSDDVVELTASSFKDVLQSDQIWMVEFYAPWCGHCKNLAPQWKKAATALKGVVQVAAVDATAEQSLGSQYGVKGFPTIKVFGANKDKPTDYNGARQADGIVQAALQEVTKMVKAQAGGGGGGGGGSGGGGGGPSAVVELDSSNFDDQVFGSEVPWLVEFYAPWCGHCKNLEPEWKSAAEKLEGEGIKLAAVDATADQSLGGRFGVKGFPTIKVFPAGSSSDSEAQDYQGGRTADAILAYADTIMVEVPVEVKQLVAQDGFDEACEAKTCILAFLPHILDSGKSGREAYLESVVKLATKNKRSPMVFLWSEGGSQPAFEQALGLTFGFPAMVAVNIKKQAYAVHRGAFDVQKMGVFITGISTGGTRVTKLQGELAGLQTIEEWDGEDAVVEEEEFSLEDIMGED